MKLKQIRKVYNTLDLGPFNFISVQIEASQLNYFICTAETIMPVPCAAVYDEMKLISLKFVPDIIKKLICKANNVHECNYGVADAISL